MDRITETVVLSDGRKVTLREMSAMDMMVASKVANAKGQVDGMAMMATSICLSIADIDGVKNARPTNLVGVQTFMAQIKAKDFAKLTSAYQRLNEDAEEGEAPAVDQQ